METPPKYLQEYMSNLVYSSDRLVRDITKNTVSSLLLTNSGPDGCRNRQSVPGLVEHPQVCLSSTKPASINSQQTGRNLQLQYVSHGTQVATQDLVCQTVTTTNRCTQTSACLGQASKATQYECISSRSTEPGSSRLSFIECNLTAQGFSAQTAIRMANKTRPSTNALYQGYWEKYRLWCVARGSDPFCPSVPTLADYFTYLFDVCQYKPKAIEGVKSCLSQAFQLADILDITHNPQLTALLRNFHLTCPPERFELPKWNLNLVLAMLMDTPFEPIVDISLKHLTYKTCFLLALASGCRSSELHAISHSLLSHSPGWSHVWLQPHSYFLAKNQSSRELSQRRSFKIKSLCDFAGPDLPERKLCPIRALRLYLVKTEARRRKQRQKSLFLSLNPSRGKEISKAAVSLWLRTVIKQAHSQCSDSQMQFARATPHEIRAVSSSLAFGHSLSLKNILETCTWKSESTFTSFYLRDLSRQFPDHVALQPCVAAGVVVR